MDGIRKLAEQVIEVFDDLLKEHKIVIPSGDCAWDQEDGAIFGDAYLELGDSIVERLEGVGEFDEHLAHQLVHDFEDLLEKHGIVIPDDDRTGAEGEAPIYGVTYGNLVDGVLGVLQYPTVEEPQNAYKEGICPVCGSNIRYGSFELSGEGGFYEYHCPECGATGKEGYDLIFDGLHYDVCTADGKPFKKEEV